MAKLTINYNNFDVEIALDVEQKTFDNDISVIDALRFLKGSFSNKDRFRTRFIDIMRTPSLDKRPEVAKEFNVDDVLDKMLDLYDEVEPFTYKESFEITDPEFQAKVFGSIDIGEMIKELGSKRIATEGIEVQRKQFSESGEFQGMASNNNIYEVHEVNGEKLGLEEMVYALKCWCTTTNEEHWLWIEDAFKDDPLAAVASTFRLPENLIPHVKELKRQGDILLVEMLDSAEGVEPSNDIVPLSSEQYFRLLTAES